MKTIQMKIRNILGQLRLFSLQYRLFLNIEHIFHFHHRIEAFLLAVVVEGVELIDFVDWDFV